MNYVYTYYAYWASYLHIPLKFILSKICIPHAHVSSVHFMHDMRTIGFLLVLFAVLGLAVWLFGHWCHPLMYKNHILDREMLPGYAKT